MNAMFDNPAGCITERETPDGYWWRLSAGSPSNGSVKIMSKFPLKSALGVVARI